MSEQFSLDFPGGLPPIQRKPPLDKTGSGPKATEPATEPSEADDAAGDEEPPDPEREAGSKTQRIQTLQDVLSGLARRDDLSPHQRQDQMSSVRTAARLLGRMPAHIPADLASLRAQLNKALPAGAGISPKRFQNIRADLKRALTAVGTGKPGYKRIQLTNAWKNCIGGLERHHGWQLSRLARWCSGRQIAPSAVDNALLEDFIADVDRNSLTADPVELRRRTIAAWNHGAAQVAGWPAPPLTRGPDARRWTIPLEDFPASLQADAKAWTSRVAVEDLFADEGPPRALRPTTIKRHQEHITCALTAAVRSGTLIGELTSLSDLYAGDRFKTILRWLHQHYPAGSTSPGQIVTTLKTIAKYHVKLPEERLARFRHLRTKLPSQRGGMTEKNRKRLRQFDNPAHVDSLITLPQRLMRQAGAGHPTAKQALLAQSAVAIEILLMAPLRIKNIVELQLGVHLDLGRRPADPIVISVQEHETKNGVPLEFRLPIESSKLVRLYLKRFLPALAPPENLCLFPGAAGGPKGSTALAGQIGGTIKKLIGCEVNAHLFRHLGAMLHLRQRPGEYEAVRRVLGHKSIDTTTNHYTGFETAAAARHFDQGIVALRREAEFRQKQVRSRKPR